MVRQALGSLLTTLVILVGRTGTNIVCVVLKRFDLSRDRSDIRVALRITVTLRFSMTAKTVHTCFQIFQLRSNTGCPSILTGQVSVYFGVNHRWSSLFYNLVDRGRPEAGRSHDS